MKLILLELNEINFDAVNHYVDLYPGTLMGFEKLKALPSITTKAESQYEELEPWIQWPSLHTGCTYPEHKIFRLGDFVKSTNVQFFEAVESSGFTVGAISPMNASNKLQKPAYFIPDPWTKTPSDGSFLSKAITSAIVQAVNDNSKSKLTVKTIVNLVIAFIALVNPVRYFSMVRYALTSFGKPWRKALFLDMLLFEIHKTLFSQKKPNFSTLFLNAGAHIQHHYFYNSSYVVSPDLTNPDWYVGKNEDPFLEMLKIYDDMLLNLLNNKNSEILIATGLSQAPFKTAQFMYRLRDHSSFLTDMGVKFDQLSPRMTRDFLVSFASEAEALDAEKVLSSILVDNEIKLFGEIDNRGKDIFVVLTYPYEITDDTTVALSGMNVKLRDLVVFVCIKNGEHQSKGFAFFSEGLSKFAPVNGSHVSKLHGTVLEFFGISKN
jgi:hypothetical protein